jgi:hypothetical protein
MMKDQAKRNGFARETTNRGVSNAGGSGSIFRYHASGRQQCKRSSAEEIALHRSARRCGHTGGVYSFLAPTPEQPRNPGTWQTCYITLPGRKVAIVQKGITIIDSRKIPGIAGDALDSHEGLPGPIYLQPGEQGNVSFKNIVITPVRN